MPPKHAIHSAMVAEDIVAEFAPVLLRYRNREVRAADVEFLRGLRALLVSGSNVAAVMTTRGSVIANRWRLATIAKSDAARQAEDEQARLGRPAPIVADALAVKDREPPGSELTLQLELAAAILRPAQHH